jgi:hypothetical protein
MNADQEGPQSADCGPRIQNLKLGKLKAEIEKAKEHKAGIKEKRESEEKKRSNNVHRTGTQKMISHKRAQ